MILDGAQACLRVLRASLYRREKEISMLMNGGEETSTVTQSAFARLLAAVVHQVRAPVYTRHLLIEPEKSEHIMTSTQCLYTKSSKTKNIKPSH